MTIKVTNYIDVSAKALELGLNVPTGLAILPTNFESARSKDELIDEELIPTIRSLWRQAGLSETRLENEDFPVEIRRSLDITLPTIFVGISLLTQNPNLVAIAINIISNYLTDFFKGILDNHKIKLDTIVQKTENQFCCVHYEGDKEGLTELPAIIEAMYNDSGKGKTINTTITEPPALIEAKDNNNKARGKTIHGKHNKAKDKTVRGKRKKHF